jgi:hypothetical protein
VNHHHRRRSNIVSSNVVLARILTEPYEVLISTGLGTYGLIVLITRDVPLSLSALEPRNVILVWAAGLAIAGLGAVYGLFRSKRVELAANILLGGLVSAYAGNVLIAIGFAGAAGAAFAIPIAAAAFLTARRIVVADKIHKVIDDAN